MKTYAIFADPFGARTFALTNKYWTVADKNSLPVAFERVDALEPSPLDGSCGPDFRFAYLRFSFTEKAAKATPAEAESQAQPIAVGKPIYNPHVHKGRMVASNSITEDPFAGNAGEYSVHHHHAGRRPQLPSGADISSDRRLRQPAHCQ